MSQQPPDFPFFPYTTLFRSLYAALGHRRLSVCATLAYARARYTRLWRIGGRYTPLWRIRGSVYAQDRKSTRLNSSHMSISYAVFCLKKKTHVTHSTIFTIQL